MARCAVRRSDGGSGVDWLAKRLVAGNEPIAGSAAPSEEEFARVQERRRGVIAELLASGVSVLPANAGVVLPISASLGALQEAEMAARRSESRRWRAHEAMVRLALDMGELREAKMEEEENERCVEAHEQELGGGSGTDTSDGDESGSGEEEEEDEDEEESEGEGEEEQQEEEQQEEARGTRRRARAARARATRRKARAKARVRKRASARRRRRRRPGAAAGERRRWIECVPPSE
jgi:hypothetical protein